MGARYGWAIWARPTRAGEIRRMDLCGIVWDMGEYGRAYAENYNIISNSMLF